MVHARREKEKILLLAVKQYQAPFHPGSFEVGDVKTTVQLM
jgi:hypothetical protein